MTTQTTSNPGIYLYWLERDAEVEYAPHRYRAIVNEQGRVIITVREQGDANRVGLVFDAEAWQARVLGQWRYQDTPVTVQADPLDIAAVNERAPWLNAQASGY